MSLSSITETWEGRDGDTSVQNGVVVETLTRSWLAKTTTALDSAVVVMTSTSLPKLFDAHPDKRAATCRKIVPSQHPESGKIWTIVATYTTAFDPRAGLDVSGNKVDPISMAAEISWETVRFTKDATKDINGKAITNAAGDRPEKGTEIDASRELVRVNKNMIAVPQWIKQYRDAVNSDAFILDGIPIDAGEAKIVGVGIQPWKNESLGETSAFISYRPVTMEIEISEEGWGLEFLNEGFYAFEGEGDERKKVLISDDNGDPVSKPVLLTPDGRKLSTEFLNQLMESGEFEGFFRKYKVYRERPFSALPLS